MFFFISVVSWCRCLLVHGQAEIKWIFYPYQLVHLEQGCQGLFLLALSVWVLANIMTQLPIAFRNVTETEETNFSGVVCSKGLSRLLYIYMHLQLFGFSILNESYTIGSWWNQLRAMAANCCHSYCVNDNIMIALILHFCFGLTRTNITFI
jgi:hypothetical protein